MDITQTLDLQIDRKRIEDKLLDVTAEDISTGEKKDCFFCMMSLAACRAYGIKQDSDGEVVSTHFNLMVTLYGPDPGTDRRKVLERVEWLYPPDVTQRIKQWDDGQHVEPFQVMLNKRK